MAQQLAEAAGGELIESVITRGDLATLTPQERTRYYVAVCKSVGLNPLTKPFAYITLNSKLTLYALRNCTDQLRTIHDVSVEELTETERDGVFIVTAKVKNASGRTDMAKGAVTINGLKGEALANAFMKAETKAKRRATLSLCGLGFLDETEIETIPAAAKAPAPAIAATSVKPPHDPATGEILPPHAIPASDGDDFNPVLWGGQFIAAVKTALNHRDIDEWMEQNGGVLDDIKENFPRAWRSIETALAGQRAKIGPDEPDLLGPNETESVLAAK